MGLFLFRNAALVDGLAAEPRPDCDVLVEDATIREVKEGRIESASAQVLDVGGRTLMPGLIDCHVHVTATDVNLGRNAQLPDSLIAMRAAAVMRGMLLRGFTTVRDVGGADIGLRMALDEGLIIGPRLVISGKALSQTGGHGDLRGRFESRDMERTLGSLGRLCDGVDGVRRAVREEIKAGADFIKIMANGGVASPTDPIAFLGFSREEITAAVEEARMAQTYVAGHLYTDEAIRRAVECGVMSVEHANLITPETARLMAERGAWAVPTLVTYEALKNEGASLGLPAVSVAKIDKVRLAGLRSLEILREAKVMMAYGSDLLGAMHRHQSAEFEIRGRVLPAQEVIQHATVNAAKVLGQDGRIGCIASGALADLIVVEGNPLKDLSVLAKHPPFVMKNGEVIRSNFG